MWTQQLDFGSADERATGVAVDSSGYAYVTGSTGYDAFVTKHAPDGTLLWTRKPGSSGDKDPYDIAVGPGAGGIGEYVFVSGRTNVTLDGASVSGYWDSFVFAYDLDGNKRWVYQSHQAYDDESRGIAVDSSGYVPAGTQLTAPYDPYIAKLRPDGVEQWFEKYGTATVNDYSYGVAVDSSGYAYISGRTSAAIDGSGEKGETDAFVAQYTPDGAHLWTRQFGSSRTDEAWAVAADPSSGGVYVAGRTFGVVPGSSGTPPNASPNSYSVVGFPR